MNCYAYPLIFDAIKSNINNNLLIELYDSSLTIYRKDEFVILRDDSGLIYYDLNNFNFYSNKPINKITILCDKYGPSFMEIFVKEYWKAAVIVQRSWKKYKKIL